MALDATVEEVVANDILEHARLLMQRLASLIDVRRSKVDGVSA